MRPFIISLISLFSFISTNLYCEIIVEGNETSIFNRKNKDSDFRNFYGITWNGKASDNLKFAKQMGYDYIFYSYGMENETEAHDIYFYLESPEYMTYTRKVDRRKAYTKEEQEKISEFCALKDASLPFPDNLASGWTTESQSFTVLPDFQQQKVIDVVVEKIIERIKEIERPNKNFLFGGIAWDVPQLEGDFYDKAQALGGKQITLSFWRGEDSGDICPGTVHDYNTYSDGRAMFYKTLYKRVKDLYPNAKFMVEPWHIYNDWIEDMQKRNDAKELMPDLVLQEGPWTDFVTDNKNFSSGLVDYNNIGCTTPNVYSEEKNREIAAMAAVHGAIFGWFGRFGGTGEMPAYKNVFDVPAWLLLVRAICGWENKNKTPLNKRKWVDGIYSSPTAYISDDVIYAKQPNTDRIFVVFNKSNSKAPFYLFKKGMKVFSSDNMLIENGVSTDDVLISNNIITLVNENKIGKAFIIKKAK
ncbi:MAG: hypothetical protein Q4F97_03620 [Bacteroidales bacterium]|nr:hypothetical protein [Bacteroidales bacterium]